MADDEQQGTAVGRPIRQPWRPFDEAAQEDFLLAIQTGAAKSIGQACRLLMLHYGTVYRWIQRGKSERYGDGDYVYRLFYARYRQAKCLQEAKARELVARAAGVDPKIALELLKLREREADRAVLRPLQVEKARAEAARAVAEAKMAEIKAELLARGLKRVNGRLYWPVEIASRMTPAERSALESLMEREGLLPASVEEVEREAQERDEEEDEHLRALAERWGMLEDRKRAVDADMGEAADADGEAVP